MMNAVGQINEKLAGAGYSVETGDRAAVISIPNNGERVLMASAKGIGGAETAKPESLDDVLSKLKAKVDALESGKPAGTVPAITTPVKPAPAGTTVAEKTKSILEKLKLTGDIRLRYDSVDHDPSVEGEPRVRFRERLRIGMELPIDPKTTVKAGFVTGDPNPRSGNQTFGASFTKKPFSLDYGFVQYKPVSTPTSSLTLFGGKMKNPLWTPSDMLWSGDVNPEGAALSYQTTPSKRFGLFVNAGAFAVDELKSDKRDPNMIVVQPGATVKISDTVDAKAALSFYNFGNFRGHQIANSSGSNSLDDNKNLACDFNPFSIGVEVGANNVLGLPRLSVFGETVINPGAEKDNKGSIFGLRLGYAKVEKPKQWQLSYSLRNLEKDAWPDFLPDDAFAGGKTGVSGSDLRLTYGLTDNTTFGLRLNKSEPIGGSKKENVLQADYTIKF